MDIKEYRREYYIKNKEKILSQLREYRQNNKDYFKQYNKEYNIINHDKLSEQRKIYYKKYSQTDKAKELKILREWKRRAIKKSTEDGTININTTTNILNEQWWICNYCWLDIMDRNIRHLDHIYPLSKWWKHSINNVQRLCSTCNLIKWSKICAQLK